MTFESRRVPSIRVSCICIDSQQNILLAKHSKAGRDYWVLPGGHLEFGETIEQCAIRELQEESGLQGTFERTLFISESIAPNGIRHIINFFCKVAIDENQLIKVGTDEDVLIGIEFQPLNNIHTLTLYPPIAKILQEQYAKGWPLKDIGSIVSFIETPWT